MSTQLVPSMIVGAFVLSASCSAADRLAPLAEPIRGVWVANVGSDVLASRERIQTFVQTCDEIGINSLFVVVWNRGITVYPSPVMEREFGIRCDPRYSDRDALKEIIEAAHAKQIRVFAWFEFGFSCSYREPDGGHILRRKPHWAARELHGQLLSKNDFQWMNALHPEVQDFMLSLLREVAENYAVDGIQGDDRLPALPSTGGYDDWTLNYYAQEFNGRRPPDNHLDEAWTIWRTKFLSGFAERMYRDLKAIDPRLIVAAAPSIFPWSRQEYLQDWPTWVANGWVDVVSPQVYRSNMKAYRDELQRIVREQVPAEKLNRLFPGILVQTADGYETTSAMVEAMVAENRRCGLQGEVIFYEAGLIGHRDVFSRFYRPLRSQR